MHHRVGVLVLAIAVSVSLHIAQVANMAHMGVRTAVGFLERIVVGSSGSASSQQVAVLVDVETMLVARR